VTVLTRSAAVIALASALVSACGGSVHTARPSASAAAPAVTFDDQGGARVACLQHQRRSPTAAYDPKQAANSVPLLTVLAYYTANGTKPYCDGKAPSSVDGQWLALYTASGADPAHIKRLD